MLPKFSYVRPSTIDAAVEALGRDGARVHGGGTDLVGCLRDRVFEAETVVSLSALDELRGIRTANGGLHVGALTTVAEVAAHEGIRESFTALSQAAAAVASPQLRNQGTLAGNLCQKPRCWYYRGDFHCLRKGGEKCFAFNGENQYHCIFGGDMCYIVHPSDTAPALAALDAVCRVSGPGASRSVAVAKLHVPPSEDPRREVFLEADEIITEVVVPAPAPGLRSSYRKVRTRAAWDFAVAGVALALVFDGDTVSSARVFLSGAAPIPWRAEGVEQAVTGTTLDEGTIAKAAKAAVAGAEPLSGNAYKLDIFRAIIAEQLEKIRAS